MNLKEYKGSFLFKSASFSSHSFTHDNILYQFCIKISSCIKKLWLEEDGDLNRNDPSYSFKFI